MLANITNKDNIDITFDTLYVIIVTNILMFLAYFRNIAKISKEQKYLLETTKTVIHLNQRLQTFGLCFHAINQGNKAEIRDLQHKLISLSMNKSTSSPAGDTLHPEIENLCFKVHARITITYSININI